MNYLPRFLIALCMLIGFDIARAEECSAMWDFDFNTNSFQPKGLSGDTNAGYAVFSFRPSPNLKLVMRGKFPEARFFSFETYSSKLLLKRDALLDFNIVPSPGSINPLGSGLILPSLSQDYEVEVSSDEQSLQGATNPMRLGSGPLLQAIMMRVYAPGVALTGAELPRVYAVDARTGQDRACPKPATVAFYLDFPQIIGRLALHSETLKFGRSGNIAGGNAAIPGYAYVLTEMKSDDIALVRFKPMPSRYASLCVQNFLKNETLSCLFDQMMSTSPDGFVYTAITENLALQNVARSRGYNVLPFQRALRQSMFGIVYRNILPSMSDQVYQGDFEPVGSLCSAQKFLDGSCG